MEKNKKEVMTRRKNAGYCLPALICLCCLSFLSQDMAAQQKNDSIRKKDTTYITETTHKTDTIRKGGNIKAYDYILPKRRGAEHFAEKNGTEHLFFSAAAGMTRLPDIGSGHAAHGPKASLYVGNWMTPVIGIRAGLDYSMWRGEKSTNLIGISADYLINLSAFAARYNPRRLFELVAIMGASYQVTLMPGMSAIHSYGLHGGLQGKFNISPAFNLFIEPQLAIYPDRIDNAYSWRRYDLPASLQVGITYKPAGFSQSRLLENGFASIAAGTGSTGNMLFNTEFALGKWLSKDRINGIRISAGSSSAFLDNEGGTDRDFNINLCADYLCNLTTLFANRKDRVFNLIFVGGIGSYFPSAEMSAPIILNGRIGLQGQIRLSEHMGLWLEPRINIYKDTRYRTDLQEPIRGSAGIMVGTCCYF